jgi:hypothetical protein
MRGVMIADDLYQTYPRHVGIGAAIPAIIKALKRLHTSEAQYLNGENPELFLAKKTREFRESPAGQKGTLTPHPSTWFNQSRYLDDPKEWWARDPKEIERMKQLSAY